MAKIVQFHEKGGPEVLKLEEVTLLPVAENDVRLRVHAIGLNRAESMYRKGAYLQDYTGPSRVGYEASGVVEAIGKNVTAFASGDAVSVVPGSISMASYGTYGEVADLPANRGPISLTTPPWDAQKLSLPTTVRPRVQRVSGRTTLTTHSLEIRPRPRLRWYKSQKSSDLRFGCNWVTTVLPPSKPSWSR
jgi:NADPH:quinone reductase-like Zn-dependent oxidoreductase